MKKNFLILCLLTAFFRLGDAGFTARAEAGTGAAEQSKPELVLQTGHSKAVETVAFSPNNQ